MKVKGVSQYELLKKHNFSSGQLDRLRKNNDISTHTIDRLCEILHCDVNEIMEYVPDSDGEVLPPPEPKKA